MSRGKSSIRQKEEYQRKQPYTPRQRMAYEPCDCDPKMIPIGRDDNLNVTGPRPAICDKCFCVLTLGECLECVDR